MIFETPKNLSAAPQKPQTESSSLVTTEQLFKIGLDRTPNTQKPQGYMIGNIKNNLRSVSQITLKELILAIKKGCTYCPAEIVGDSHKADNWKSQQIFCVDIDNALKKGEPLPEGQYISPSKALEICKGNNIKPFFIYHSFSSKEKFEKFRICIVLDRLITDTNTRLNIIKAFISLFGNASDKACTNADRIFYGSVPECEIYSDLNAITDTNTLLEIYKQIQPAEKPENLSSAVSSLAMSQSNSAPKKGLVLDYNKKNIGSSDWSKTYDADPDQLLFCLDPDSEYADWFKYTMAYKAANGTFNTWVNWCKSSSKWKDSDQNVWRTAPKINNIGQLKSYALETNKGQDYINSLKQAQEQAKKDFIQQQRSAVPKNIAVSSSKSPPFHLFNFGDSGNAQRFLYLADNLYKFNYTTEKWLYYTGKKWEEDSKHSIDFVVDSVRQFMTKIEMPYWKEVGIEDVFEKHKKASLSRTSAKNMLEEAQHHVAITSQELDTDKYKFNTQSHLINLNSGAMEQHNKNQLVTKISPCSIPENISAPPVKFLNFLSQVLNDNVDLINYIQRLLGYCLTGDISEQGLYILYGDGRNGKSVFIELIKYLWGDYAQNMQIDTIVRSQLAVSSSSPTPDIARLKGARLVTTVEPNENVRLDESKIKQLTGGDEITARELHSNPITFNPECKIFMATNHKPYISGTDFGIWRRIHLIPFTVQIPESQVNKNLLNELKAEKDSIFKWILDGYRYYKLYGLSEPKVMEQAKAEYRKEMDVVEMFLDECESIEINPEKSISAGELYNIYTSWCSQVGRCPYSLTKFGMEIGKRFEKVKTKKSNIYIGIGKVPNYNNPYS